MNKKSSIRVGNAPVSWGVFGAAGPNPPFSAVLDAIAETGYEGTELGPYGYLPTDPQKLDAELRRRGLKLASSFVGLPLADAGKRNENVRRVLEVGRLLATQAVPEVILADLETDERRDIAGRVPADNSAGWNDAQWKVVKDTVHAAADALKSELKMRLVMHHHSGTHVETAWEIERFLAETNPEQVGLLLDTGHAVYGGADPLEVLKRHGKRVQYIHFKDAHKAKLEKVRTTRITMPEAWVDGVFCALGEGVVDFPELVERLHGLGYQGWGVVEQDIVADKQGRLNPDPTECAGLSRRYLREQCGLG